MNDFSFWSSLLFDALLTAASESFWNLASTLNVHVSLPITPSGLPMGHSDPSPESSYESLLPGQEHRQDTAE
jgi:hypothetical protein